MNSSSGRGRGEERPARRNPAPRLKPQKRERGSLETTERGKGGEQGGRSLCGPLGKRRAGGGGAPQGLGGPGAGRGAGQAEAAVGCPPRAGFVSSPPAQLFLPLLFPLNQREFLRKPPQTCRKTGTGRGGWNPRGSGACEDPHARAGSGPRVQPPLPPPRGGPLPSPGLCSLRAPCPELGPWARAAPPARWSHRRPPSRPLAAASASVPGPLRPHLDARESFQLWSRWRHPAPFSRFTLGLPSAL